MENGFRGFNRLDTDALSSLAFLCIIKCTTFAGAFTLDATITFDTVNFEQAQSHRPSFGTLIRTQID